MKKLQPYQKITSQEQLDNLINNNNGEPLPCFIMLNFGLRSSKDIWLEEDEYTILNEIDDSYDHIPHDKFLSSFLGEAMAKGSLYKY